jgi:competence protein ComEA
VSDQPHAPLVATPRNPVAQPPGPRKVNLNVASADELDALPMIGLNRANQIIAFRQANGPFGAVDDLKNVPGIGDGTMKAVRHLLEVR